MIEIMEIKDTVKKNLLGMPGDTDRVFVFLDKKDTLATIHFSIRHPQLAELVALKVNDTNNLSDDLIVDGLIRTACHIFFGDNISWIVAEEEMVNQNDLLAAFFTSFANTKRPIPDDIPAEILKYHSNDCVINTDIIYKGCCEGD